MSLDSAFDVLANTTNPLTGRFVVFVLNVLLHDVGQWSVARLVALHYFAALLVDYYYMVVFVDYVHKGKC